MCRHYIFEYRVSQFYLVAWLGFLEKVYSIMRLDKMLMSTSDAHARGSVCSLLLLSPFQMYVSLLRIS